MSGLLKFFLASGLLLNCAFVEAVFAADDKKSKAMATSASKPKKSEKKIWQKPVISLSVNTGRPKSTTTRSGSRFRNSYSTGSQTKTRKSTYTYDGRLYCKMPEDEKTTITLEVLYIKRVTDSKGMCQEEIFHTDTIGTYDFVGDKDCARSFTFTSPEITSTRTKKRSRRWGSTRSESSRSGTYYLGCIVRALMDGKPVKVKSVPGKTSWERAGKMDNPSLKNANRL
jgi:hypothetical protein